MYVYVLKHVEAEGPGTLGAFLESKGVDVITFDLFRDSAVLRDLRQPAALISMGGPMNTYEEHRYPFLRDEINFLREAIRRGCTTLGICLGAQLLARACEAPVTIGAAPEIGFSRVHLTPEGQKDPLFQGIHGELDVFQWHADAFEVPDGGTLIAIGEPCRNQAFRYGSNAYGLQFHIETTREMIEEWFEGRPEKIKALETFMEISEQFAATAHLIYANFLGIMIQSRNRRIKS